jgi:inorganic pyrophosphatase
MKVFIENEAGLGEKNLFDEKTLEYKKTVTVSRKYPYPYGFVLSTTSGDGDNLDCFVLTTRPLKSKEIIEVEPIGMMEQFEDGQEDHKILAVLPGERAEITEDIQATLKGFVEHVFDHLPGKKVTAGNFYGKDEALKLLEKCSDEV